MCQGYASKKEWLIWAVLMRFATLRWVGKRMYFEWKHWLVVMLMLPLIGCATMWTVAQSPVFQRAVEYGVIRYLSSEPDQQPQALEIVQYLQQSVDQEAQVTVSDLENLAMDQIPWSDLDMADQYLLRSMIEDIADHLRDKVGSGVLAEDDKVQLKDFLKWMEQAIRFAGA